MADDDEDLTALFLRARKKPNTASVRRARETKPLAQTDVRSLSTRGNRKGRYYRFPVAFVGRLVSLSVQHEMSQTAIIEEAVNQWARERAE